MTYNALYFIGIILSFGVGFAGVWISIRNTRKTSFINSITSARIKYIQDIRNAVSEFCGLVYSYNATLAERQQLVSISPEEELAKKKDLWEIQKKYDHLKYLIQLHLNVEDDYFDKIIIGLLDEIIAKTDKNPSGKIRELIIVMQYLLKLEWEGAKLESQVGIVSKRAKKRLYNKYKLLHENYVKEKGAKNEQMQDFESQ